MVILQHIDFIELNRANQSHFAPGGVEVVYMLIIRSNLFSLVPYLNFAGYLGNSGE